MRTPWAHTRHDAAAALVEQSGPGQWVTLTARRAPTNDAPAVTAREAAGLSSTGPATVHGDREAASVGTVATAWTSAAAAEVRRPLTSCAPLDQGPGRRLFRWHAHQADETALAADVDLVADRGGAGGAVHAPPYRPAALRIFSTVWCQALRAATASSVGVPGQSPAER